MIDLKKALEFSEKLAWQAGKYLIENQTKVEIVKWKDRQDVCTNIDLETEKIIVGAIEKEYPKHNIVSEELGEIDKKSPFAWYIDPLDGTKEYVRGIPWFNTSFCLVKNCQPICSAVYEPISDQLYSAARAQGAFLNGRLIKVNNKDDLKDSIVFAHYAHYQGEELKTYLKVFQTLGIIASRCYRLRGYAEENISLCYLAKGAIEAAVNIGYPAKSIQDLAPGYLVAREAGAKITDTHGQPIEFKEGKDIFYIASNGLIHNELLEIIK